MTNKPKTAEEIAKKLSEDIESAMDSRVWTEEDISMCTHWITEALTEYAEAHVKEERERFDKRCLPLDHVHFECHIIEKSNKDIHNSAIESAALEAEFYSVNLANKIRRMKKEPSNAG